VTDLAPVLQGFFTDRLARQKKASPNTVAAYRDTCRLLLAFAQGKTGKTPSSLSLADLDATLIGEFLQHLEEQRGNASATRNARLAAIHSLFKYAAPRAPEHAAVISQVLAIPPRRRERAIVSYLTPEEADAMTSTWAPGRTSAATARAVRTGPPPSPPRPSRSCGPGSPSSAPTPPARCSPPSQEDGSLATPSKGSSPSTPLPPRAPARPSRTSTSPRTRCGTPPP
jgi:hypothetical protein